MNSDIESGAEVPHSERWRVYVRGPEPREASGVRRFTGALDSCSLSDPNRKGWFTESLDMKTATETCDSLRQPKRLISIPVAVMLVCLLHVGSSVRADEELDQIAILQSAANPTQKSAACQRLRVIGTVTAVPALSSLLTEERTSHFARHVLEGMPFPEAGAALRVALGKTAGKPEIQAGIINSLGRRRDSESIELLATFLASTNLDLAVSAASALGQIGGRAVAHILIERGAGDPLPGVLGTSASRSAAQESLIECAEGLAHDESGTRLAADIYRTVFSQPASEAIRVAAWRGLALRDARSGPELVREALSGRDRRLQLGALGLLREWNDRSILGACLADWDQLPVESQVALLDAHVRLDAEPLPIVRKALASSNLVLRVAALDTLADLGDSSVISILAKSAARGEPSEREAAREALARTRGLGVREALLDEIDQAESPERAELLRALGERGDRRSAAKLIEFAEAEAQPVRLAALESLQRLALPETLTPLLDLAARAKSEDQVAPILKALVAVCQASRDQRETESRVIAAVRQSASAERRLLMPLLAELGTADALAAVQSVTRDQDPEMSRQAVRLLGQWPNSGPASYLVDLAQSAADPSLHVLALRGAVGVSSQEHDAAKRLALLERAMGVARRADEKRQALGQVGEMSSPEALGAALKRLADPDLAEEAGMAAIAVAERLAATDSGLADEAAVQVLGRCKAADTVRRAWALRRAPASSGPFIRNWIVCGPFRRSGIEGATALFDVAFGPEVLGETVEWKPVPAADHVDLSSLFPGQANCVAYLRTQVVALEAGDALLLMGSDDGLQVWLDGDVVHSNNVDRGMIVDQDRAPIRLKKGANQLLFKVTQGGGGWAACARIAGADGQPIPGLRIEAAQP